MGSGYLAAVEVVSPVVNRADDVLGVAGAGEHLGLAMAADIRDQLRAAIVLNEQLAGLQTSECEVVAVFFQMCLVAGERRTGGEKRLAFDFQNFWIEVP